MHDILITDGHQRKTLSAVRSLGSKGLKAACCESTRMNPSCFSKYCSGFYKTPGPEQSDEAYLEQLVTIIRDNRIDILMPMDDRTTGIAVRNSEYLREFCGFALPAAENYAIISDKRSAFDHAVLAGLNCPATVNSMIDGDSDMPEISGLGFPLIIKPRHSSGSRGMRVVRDKVSFAEEYRKISASYPDPLVQEFIEIVDKIDVCMIFNKKNEMRACLVQKELRNYPDPLGPSTIQETIIDEKAVALALEFMKDIEWTGPVEIEFVKDKNGEYYFLEANTRFWASLELSVLSGVDFPYLYFMIAKTGDCPVVAGPEAGVRTKWSFPGEVLALLDHVKKKKRPEIPFFFTGKYGIINDTFRSDDLLPSGGLILSAIYHVINRERRRAVLRR